LSDEKRKASKASGLPPHGGPGEPLRKEEL
jgi:hypothetical protein